MSLRRWGKAPYEIVLMHGGPGAWGEMAPLAQELAPTHGILEPLQTSDSVEGLLEELRVLLEMENHSPRVLIGFSWGAWLGILFAARYPLLVKKLVLISSGPIEEKWVQNLMEKRLNRLNTEERARLQDLLIELQNPLAKDKDALLEKAGALFSKADAFDPIPDEPQPIQCHYDLYEKIWEEAKKIRASGDLLEAAKKIRCPVVAIHGEHDSHPFEGVKGPLSAALKDFQFILLHECGHCPWQERKAKGPFLAALEKVIR